MAEKTLKAVYFPEIPAVESLKTEQDERLDGQDLLPGSTPADRIADAPWVLKAGDTMTGALLMNLDSTDTLDLNSNLKNFAILVSNVLSGSFTAADSRVYGIYTSMNNGSSDEDQLLIDIQIGEFTET